MSESDEIKADIERTRAELADTVDSLSAKLDVKAQARHRVEEIEHKVAAGAADSYVHAKAKVPEPVQQAIGKVEDVARPVVAKAGEDKRRTLAIAGGTLVVLLVVRRVRRRRRFRDLA